MPAKGKFTPAPKPTLESVLEWAEVDYHPDRVRQMVYCPLLDKHDGARTAKPHMSINREKQVWKCQSCGAGGDAWSLIMEKDHIDFRTATKVAASQSFTTRADGGGNDSLPGFAFGRGAGVPRGKGAGTGRPAFRPSWRS